MAAYTFRDERDLLWYSTVFSSGRAGKRRRHQIDGSDAQRGHRSYMSSVTGTCRKLCGTLRTFVGI